MKTLWIAVVLMVIGMIFIIISALNTTWKARGKKTFNLGFLTNDFSFWIWLCVVIAGFVLWYIKDL